VAGSAATDPQEGLYGVRLLPQVTLTPLLIPFPSSQWSPDGTQLAGACGGGRVAFAQLTDRSLEYGSVTATLTEPKKILVEDARNKDTEEELDFPRDRVVEFALGYEHLVVCTASQCFIYESPNYNTPQIFDLRNPVNLIVLSQKR